MYVMSIHVGFMLISYNLSIPNFSSPEVDIKNGQHSRNWFDLVVTLQPEDLFYSVLR